MTETLVVPLRGRNCRFCLVSLQYGFEDGKPMFLSIKVSLRVVGKKKSV